VNEESSSPATGYIPFIDVILLVSWQEAHLAHNKIPILLTSLQETAGENDPRGSG